MNQEVGVLDVEDDTPPLDDELVISLMISTSSGEYHLWIRT